MNQSLWWQNRSKGTGRKMASKEEEDRIRAGFSYINDLIKYEKY